MSALSLSPVCCAFMAYTEDRTGEVVKEEPCGHLRTRAVSVQRWPTPPVFRVNPTALIQLIAHSNS